jgi:hypothetical protein
MGCIRAADLANQRPDVGVTQWRQVEWRQQVLPATLQVSIYYPAVPRGLRTRMGRLHHHLGHCFAQCCNGN